MMIIYVHLTDLGAVPECDGLSVWRSRRIDTQAISSWRVRGSFRATARSLSTRGYLGGVNRAHSSGEEFDLSHPGVDWQTRSREMWLTDPGSNRIVRPPANIDSARTQQFPIEVFRLDRDKN